jgi:hypothetical protein
MQLVVVVVVTNNEQTKKKGRRRLHPPMFRWEVVMRVVVLVRVQPPMRHVHCHPWTHGVKSNRSAAMQRHNGVWLLLLSRH